jgi:hypothetical protein
MKTKNKILIGLVIFGVLSVIFIFFQNQYQNANAEQQKPDFGWGKMIQDLQAELNQKGMSAEDQAAINAKLQSLYFNETQQAKTIRYKTMYPAQAAATLAAPIPTPFPQMTLGPRKTGIIDSPSVPFPSMVYMINNAWQDNYKGGFIIVYAGSMTLDGMQGVLLVFDEGTGKTIVQLTPIRNGELTIKDYQNGRLIITTSTNYQYYFDISSLTFVDNSGNPLTPVATPAPLVQTPTPGSSYPPPQ